MPLSTTHLIETLLPLSWLHPATSQCPMCRRAKASASEETTSSALSQGHAFFAFLSAHPSKAPLLVSHDGNPTYTFPLTLLPDGRLFCADICYLFNTTTATSIELIKPSARPPAQALSTPTETPSQSRTLSPDPSILPPHIIITFPKLTLRLWLPSPSDDSLPALNALISGLRATVPESESATPKAVVTTLECLVEKAGHKWDVDEGVRKMSEFVEAVAGPGDGSGALAGAFVGEMAAVQAVGLGGRDWSLLGKLQSAAEACKALEVRLALLIVGAFGRCAIRIALMRPANFLQSNLTAVCFLSFVVGACGIGGTGW